MLVYSLFFSIYLSIFLIFIYSFLEKIFLQPFSVLLRSKKILPLFLSLPRNKFPNTHTSSLLQPKEKKKTQTNNDFYNLLFRKHLKSVVKTQLPISPHLFLSLLFGNYCYSASAITRHTYNTLQTHKHNTNGV